MNTGAIIANVKLMIGIQDDSQDALLELLLRRIEGWIKDFCSNDFIDGFPAELEGVVEELVVLRYHQLGREGKAGERLGDYQAQFTNSIPQHMLNQLYKYRLLRVHKYEAPI